MAQQCLERVGTLVGGESGVTPVRDGGAFAALSKSHIFALLGSEFGGATDLGPQSPADRNGGKALGSAPPREFVQPAVSRGVRPLAGRAHQAYRRREEAEPVQGQGGRGHV